MFQASVILAGSLTFGLSMGFPALTMVEISAEFNLLFLAPALFNAVASLAAILGPITANFIMIHSGKVIGLRTFAALGLFSWFLFFIATIKTQILLFIHRIILGVVVGGLSTICPVFLVQIAPPQKAGMYGTLNQLGISTGCFLSALIGGMVKWRGLASFCCAVLFYIFIGSFFIRDGRENGNNEPTGRDQLLKKMFPRITHLKELFTCGVFMFIQQFCGINAVLTNAGEILESNYTPAIAAFAQCISCLVCANVIEKLGRGKTWIISCLGSSVSMILFAISLHFDFPSILKTVFVFCYLLSFGFGLGPIPWFLPSELFPKNERGFASTIISTVNWIFSFGVIILFPMSQQLMGMTMTLFLFAIIVIVGGIFGYSAVRYSGGDGEMVDVETEGM